LRHVIKKRWAVVSRIDGSDHPQATNNIHVGPTICLGGTHVRGPRGFIFNIRVGPTSGGTHTFGLWGSQLYYGTHG
jgi:hypothetical protein